MACNWHTLVVLLAGLAIGLPPAEAQDAHITLEEIGSYGVAEFPSPDSSVAAGAAFGFIEELALGESHLYVLDRDLYKISVFDKESGSFLQNILGGEGRGPGEFRLPIAMTLTPDGQVAVYDYENRKISFFDPESGEDTDEMGLPAVTRSLAATGDRIWIGSMHRRSHFFYSVRQGERITSPTQLESHVEVPEDDLEYVDRSVVSALDAHPETGEIYFDSPRPSLWYAWDGKEAKRFGREVHSEGGLKKDPRGNFYTENQSVDICSMNRSYVVVLWMHLPREEGMENERYQALDFYRRDGAYVGRHRFDYDFTTNMVCEDHANVLYLARSNPYQRVVKYRVTLPN